MASVHTRSAAKRDLIEHYVYLAEHAGLETADRFLLHVNETLRHLARHQQMGMVLSVRRPELAGIRKWHVKSFEKFLIFYVPRPDGISIVRLLHAAQDWWNLLELQSD